jgi:hypothetical protein
MLKSQKYFLVLMKHIIVLLELTLNYVIIITGDYK